MMARKRDKMRAWIKGRSTLSAPDANMSDSNMSGSNPSILQQGHHISPSVSNISTTSNHEEEHEVTLQRPLAIHSNPVNEPPIARGSNKILWAQAFEKVPEQTRNTLLYTTNTTQPPQSPEQLRQHIERLALEKQQTAEARAWKFDFNGRQVILRDVAGKIITWLDRMKAVGDVAVNFDPVHAALPWAAVRFVLLSATADSQQHGQLLVGMEQVTYLLLRCAVYESIYAASDTPDDGQAALNFETALVELYSNILSFLALYLGLLSRSTTARAKHALFNPGELGQYMTSLQDLEARTEVEFSIFERLYQRHLQTNLGERYTTLQAVLSSQVLRVDSTAGKLWSGQQEQEAIRILQWLSVIPYKSDHLAAKNGRVDGTAEWLLDHQIYNDWRNTSASMILWLHGIRKDPSFSGLVDVFHQKSLFMCCCGKTKLSSKVIDDMIGLMASDDINEGLAYFYCDRNQEDRQQPMRVLQSIVRQLATQHTKTTIMSIVLDVYNEHKKEAFALSEITMQDCRRLLTEMLAVYSQTTIVIDGLDECNKETRHELLDILDELLSSSSHPIKIFIASRNDGDLKARYQEGRHLEIQATDNQGDIEQFVQDKLDKSPQFRDKISMETQQEVISVFRIKSQQMFQWTALHIDDLLKLRRDQDVLQYLHELPQGLKNAYDKLYQGIATRKGSWKQVADRAFQWLMGSYRPLSPSELVAAACQDQNNDIISPVDIDIDFVLDACHNLITVVEVDLAESTAGSSKAFTCRFAHLSVQEYFETHHWTQQQVHQTIASVCLKVLKDSALDERFPCWRSEESVSDDSSSGGSDTRIVSEGSPDLIPLFNYVHGWFIHVRMADGGEVDVYQAEAKYSELVADFAFSRCQDWISRFHSRGFEVITSDGSFDLQDLSVTVAGSPDPLLELLAALGLAGPLKLLSESDPSRFVDLMEDSEDGLCLAAHYTHPEVCQYMLNNGAQAHINKSHVHFGTAIQAAAYQGSLELVKLLLAYGAEANSAGGTRSTPIQVAAVDGRPKLVSLLLANGANVNCSQGYFQSPLHAAASGRGSNETVKLLLEAGAEINTPSSLHGTALQCAAQWGHQGVVDLLLDSGADPNIEGGYYGTPLQAAIYSGSAGAVQQLLDAGADPDTVAGFYGTALQAAASYGHPDAVEMLLAAGADPNIRAGYFGSALEAVGLSVTGGYIGYLADRRRLVGSLIRGGAKVELGGDYGVYLYDYILSQQDTLQFLQEWNVPDEFIAKPWDDIRSWLETAIASRVPVLQTYRIPK
ncbi:hypothetical protein FZEAL_8485 [Fusarium zealandicum]|uniref:NWD NACHT-NTPase N-terminal domain-containing protein n=1 Tax=Fusarium zealandicum TaxID=1053134 RepID=A0A8H4UEQ7_9HYPO|nr:hypothetical protein FZEAL_8485 [Fusarium zealandicum]